MNLAERERIVRQLYKVWDESYDALLDRLAVVINDPVRWREAQRLNELLEAHDAYMNRLADGSRAWWTNQLPSVYRAGIVDMASMIGRPVSFTAVHEAAVETFVQRTWTDVAARLQRIDSKTRQAIRGWARDATRSGLLESRTAIQAGRELSRVAAKAQMWSVTYVNGAEVPMNVYSEMLARTTTATAYNEGEILQARQEGFTHMMYMDSPDCGLTFHDDPVKADGLVVPIDDVIPLSHPNCVRSLVPYVPDIDEVAELARQIQGGDDQNQTPIKAVVKREPRAGRRGFDAKPARTPRRVEQ